MPTTQSKIAKQPNQIQTAKQTAEHTQRQPSQAQDKTTHQTSQVIKQIQQTNQVVGQTQPQELKTIELDIIKQLFDALTK